MKVLKSLQPLFVLLISPITSTTFKIFPSNSNSYADDYPHHVSKQFQQSSTSFVTNPLHLIKRSTRSSSRKLSPKILRSPRLTNWGSWADYVSVCPDGEFVVGMQLKTDAFHGNHHNGAVADNTALNGIKFFCSSQPIILNESTMPPTFTSRNGTIIHTYELISIQNEVQKWGRWGSPFYCLRGGYALGFQMRSHKPLDSGAGFGFKFDDVGACNLRLFCSTGEILHGDGRNEWGVWTNIQSCPTGQALCSLRTQIERDQLFLDDTALNNIDVGCCKVPKGHSWITLKELNKKNNNLAHDYVSTSTDQPVASLQPTSPTKATNIIQPGSQEEESMTNFETTHQSTNIINSIIESLLKGWTTHKRGFILRKSIFKWTQPISSE